MEKKFSRGSIVVRDTTTVLVTGDRSKRDDHFSGVCIYSGGSYPVGDFSDTWHINKFKKLYETFEEWLKAKVVRSGAVWVKASNPDIKNGEYVAKYKAPGIKLKHDFVGMAFVDDQFVYFVCPCHYDLKWARGHEELQYAQILDESGAAPSGEREVAFAEWIRENKFRPFTNGRWIKLETGEIRTSEQLHELFKQNRNNENS